MGEKREKTGDEVREIMGILGLSRERKFDVVVLGLKAGNSGNISVFQSGCRILSLLLKPSTDWMKPTHIMLGNLLYLKSTDF